MRRLGSISLCGGMAVLILAGCWQARQPLDYTGPTADWPVYGGPEAQHYSILNQITPDNVASLELAWEHRSGDASDGSGEWTFSSFQVTPIVVDRTLYYCTPFGRVFALDPETGEERWQFDPEISNKKGGYYPAVCRGVAYWQEPQPIEGQACQKRIVYGTRDAELIALDAETGLPCADFGERGRVALRENVGAEAAWEYYPTSPPLIMADKAVIGALVPDNMRTEAPAGVVRAFDVRSGELAWAWDPVSAEYAARHQIDGQTRYHRGTPNIWGPMSGDAEQGLVFVPTGNPSPDLYGGERDGNDTYGSSIVALDIHTGAPSWHFQTVHNDIWDYDLAAQPLMFRIDGVGGGRPAVVAATKVGHVFLLDRETGEPLYPVEERPVPQDGVPGERLSPTQPFPTHPGPLHLPQQLTADDMDGMLWFDRRDCQRQLAQYRNDGVFTPPSLQGSVQFPSTMGGINWGGVAVDPQRKLMLVNQSHMAAVVQLVPRAEYDAEPRETVYPEEWFAMHGTPYGAKRTALMSPLGAPCTPRPWGSLLAVDLESGDVIWRQPLGTTADQAPLGLSFNWGTPNAGGGIATASGLFFIGATADSWFRAYDVATGKQLWRYRIPTTANATPLTYRLSEQGRQYVVVAAGGHGWSTPSDHLMAFALPQP